MFSHGTVGNAGWAERRRLARVAVERMRPDVLGLQEVFPSMHEDVRAITAPLELVLGPSTGKPRWFDVSKPAGYVLEALRTGKPPAKGWHDMRNSERMRAGEHLPIAYRADRLRPIEEGGFWISRKPDVPGSMLALAPTPFLVHWIRFDRLDADGRVLFLNAHYGHAPWHHRPTAHITAAHIARLAPESDRSTHVFLVGDFNAWTSSPLVRDLTTPGRGGLVNAAREAPEQRGPRATFHWGRGETPLNVTLDHVLARTSLRPKSAEIVDVREGNLFPSDHHPLVVEFDGEYRRA